MKLKMFLLLTLFCITGGLFAADIERDQMMWAEAYQGNYSLVHKMALTRQVENINDEVINQLIMAYLYYRMGHYDQIYPIFNGMDRYFESRIAAQEE